MSARGSCHCHSVRLLLTALPEQVVACDCSLCSRRGMLWAHYADNEVAVEGFTEGYEWGDETISFRHCPKCGCTTHWESRVRTGGSVAVNARLIDGFAEEGGASTSSYSFAGRPAELRFKRGANG